MNLVIIQNRQAVTTSLQIAESFGKRHDHVVRDIEDILEGLLKIEGNEKDLCQKPSYFNEKNVFGGVPMPIKLST